MADCGPAGPLVWRGSCRRAKALKLHHCAGPLCSLMMHCDAAGIKPGQLWAHCPTEFEFVVPIWVVT